MTTTNLSPRFKPDWHQNLIETIKLVYCATLKKVLEFGLKNTFASVFFILAFACFYGMLTENVWQGILCLICVFVGLILIEPKS